MRLSQQWTAEKFMKHVLAQFPSVDWTAYAQRFDLINQVQNAVADRFYSLMWQAYVTPAVLVYSTTGKYGASGMSYASSTQTLTATLDTDFEDDDVGKLVVFRYDTAVYVGIIDSITSATSVVLHGDNLPTSPIASLTAVIVAGTAPPSHANAISIGSLPVMRAAQGIRLALESTSTQAVEAISLEELRAFRPSAPANAKKLVWCVSGSELLYELGDSLDTAGTLTLRYPRVPEQVYGDQDYLDLPDGIPIQIALLLLKRIIGIRFAGGAEDTSREMAELIGNLYQGAGVALQGEEIRKKVEALG